MKQFLAIPWRLEITCLLSFVLLALLAGCRPVSTVTGAEPSPLPPTGTPFATAPLPTAATTDAHTALVGEMLEPTPFSVPFNPTYSESAPLTDVQQMLAILEDLRQLEFTGLTNPGWYLRYDLYGENNTPADDELNFLVHVVDDRGNCQEQMAFYRKDSRVSPFTFMSADGVTGIIKTSGETRVLEVDARMCDLADPYSLGLGTDYFILSNKLVYYRRTLELIGETKGRFGDSQYIAWFAREDEREVFVVHFATTNVRQAVSMDPESGQSLPITSSLRWDAYDLISGRPLRSREETTLSNGKVVYSEVRYVLEYYPEPPEELRAALDQAVAGLETFTD